MGRKSSGGKIALRGFWYQILYSILKTTYGDISEYSPDGDNFSARFVYEGYNEEDLIVSYPGYTEYVQIKTRRSKNNFWTLSAVILIFGQLLQQVKCSVGDMYTFVTDGKLDNNASKFLELCKLIKQLKTSNITYDGIIKVLNDKDIHFNSKSTLFGSRGLKGSYRELLKCLLSIYNLSDNTELFNVLSKVNIIEGYQESIIESAIVDTLKPYIPNERIKQVINELIAEIIRVAKDAPIVFSRDQLFKSINVPTIPLTTRVIKKACSSLIHRNSSFHRELLLNNGISRPKLEGVVAHFMQDKESRYFLLTGNSGVGKTVSCTRLAFSYSKIFPTIYIAAERFRDRDPIEIMSIQLSTELGRSETLPIRTIILRMGETALNSQSKLIIICDGIDMLTPKRFGQIFLSIYEYFIDLDVKFLFSCKQEKLDDYLELFKNIKLYSHTEISNDYENQASFILKDYNEHEFHDALNHYGYQVSRIDDLGNSILFNKNIHLHRPLYLSIFSQISKNKKPQYPPSLSISLIFEVYFENIVTNIAQDIDISQTKSIENLIWDTIVTIAKQITDHNDVSITDIHSLMVEKYKHFSSQVYTVISTLLNIGLIYENIVDPLSKAITKTSVLMSPTPVVSFYHLDIAKWILAFDNAKNLLKQDINYLHNIFQTKKINEEVIMAFGIICRMNQDKYNDLVLKILTDLNSAKAACDLMQVLNTPDRPFIMRIINILKEKNRDYHKMLESLSSLYIDRGIQSNAMSLYYAAGSAFEAALEITENTKERFLSDFFYRKVKSVILNNLAVSYNKADQKNMAIEMYHKAIDLEPNWQSYFNLSIIVDNKNEALRYIDKALDLDFQMSLGTKFLILNHKAAILFRSGEINKACSIWKSIVEVKLPPLNRTCL
ncbi:MAG: hypothetical protein M0R37_14800 [Bacteroidales bacterium]|nr:hypothetical protein [Bacteroidales bacterium]